MPVLRNIGRLVTCADAGGQGALHPIERAALAWEDDRLAWIGPERELPAACTSWDAEDAGGRLVIPGLVDCHTHLAFGGWRAQEFERRLRGESYLDIARAGGGIASTVRATRAASADALLARCRATLDAMARLGVTTVEAKSGYGLDEANELKLLEVYRTLSASHSVRLLPTFLGAHIVPPEYADRRAAYVDLLCTRLIPAIAQQGLARCCDVFVEETAFTVEEARTILRAGQAHGLRAKLHADQLHDGGGAALAAELRAVSADHLEHVSDEGIARLRDAGVVAVSLPIATLYLCASAPAACEAPVAGGAASGGTASGRQDTEEPASGSGSPGPVWSGSRSPGSASRDPAAGWQVRPMPARALIAAGVPVAVATDFNPGSAPSYHLPLALTLACTLQRMTPAEALKGATLYAARAIGLDAEIGSLEPGKSADFALIDAPDEQQWVYHFQPNACVGTWVRGRRVV